MLLFDLSFAQGIYVSVMRDCSWLLCQKEKDSNIRLKKVAKTNWVFNNTFQLRRACFFLRLFLWKCGESWLRLHTGLLVLHGVWCVVWEKPVFGTQKQCFPARRLEVLKNKNSQKHKPNCFLLFVVCSSALFVLKKHSLSDILVSELKLLKNLHYLWFFGNTFCSHYLLPSKMSLPTPPLKKGWLKKQSRTGLVKNWQTRHFVLSAGRIYYFQEQSDRFPFGEGMKVPKQKLSHIYCIMLMLTIGWNVVGECIYLATK